MELPPLGFIHDYVPIPPLFHSEQKEGPFETCLVCERPLLIDGVQYMVEKAFRDGRTIFEFAICSECHDNWTEEISPESMRRIDAHFAERVDFVDRRKALLEAAPDDADAWIDSCILSQQSRAESDEYQVFAHCDGGDLLFSYMPYMICGEAMDGLFALLSKKTRESLEDFTGRHLGMPPEFADPRLLMF